ncbi:MAG: hypothetical protein M1816_005432 [Peltula sp. TS41687]|nr:MAG: hypothetical protein M1816_005432 [Peltula sp. TS41687]
MVRLKNRYLLVHILYPPSSSKSPPPPTTTNNNNTSSAAIPIPTVVEFHAPTPSSLTPQLLTRTIRSSIASLYGDYGVGVTSSGLAVKYLSPATSTFILRVSRAHYRLAWAALTFITKLPLDGGDARVCVLRVVRVSGTIRKAEEEAIRRARNMVLRAKAAIAGWGRGLEGLRIEEEVVGDGGEVREEVRVDDGSGSDAEQEEEEEDEEVVGQG